jgi:hypothetical protein
MSELPYKVGYGRPPAHNRFQKGQSGNPGGRSRAEIRTRANPEKMLKLQFEVALVGWLSVDEEVLRKARPTKAIDCLARRLALQAVDGAIPAQKLVFAILERRAGNWVLPPEEEMPEEPAAEALPMDDCRELLGERYDEFRSRFDKAIETGSSEDLLDLVEEFGDVGEFPEAANS